MLRALHERDVTDLMQIELACQITPWSDEVFRKCLLAGSKGWVMELEGKIIGFILILFQAGEVHVLNFCVHPAYQHRGWGKQLLHYMLQDIKEQQAKLVYLEVRRSNEHAIKLYENAGFCKVGERKEYYLSSASAGREDALVFAMQLASE
jgi:ribosomal-protein-alanine N-acetyltransferase